MTIVRWDPFRDFGLTAPNNWAPRISIHRSMLRWRRTGKNIQKEGNNHE